MGTFAKDLAWSQGQGLWLCGRHMTQAVEPAGARCRMLFSLARRPSTDRSATSTSRNDATQYRNDSAACCDTPAATSSPCAIAGSCSIESAARAKASITGRSGGSASLPKPSHRGFRNRWLPGRDGSASYSPMHRAATF